MNSHAYLLAMLTVNDSGELQIRGLTIASEENPTCSLQKQAYACLEKTSGPSYQEARNTLLTSIKWKAEHSQPNSLWKAIAHSLKMSGRG